MILHFAAEKSNQKGERQKVGLAEVKNSWGQCNTEEKGSTRESHWKGKILRQLDSKN